MHLRYFVTNMFYSTTKETPCFTKRISIIIKKFYVYLMKDTL